MLGTLRRSAVMGAPLTSPARSNTAVSIPQRPAVAGRVDPARLTPHPCGSENPLQRPRRLPLTLQALGCYVDRTHPFRHVQRYLVRLGLVHHSTKIGRAHV